MVHVRLLIFLLLLWLCCFCCRHFLVALSGISWMLWPQRALSTFQRRPLLLGAIFDERKDPVPADFFVLARAHGGHPLAARVYPLWAVCSFIASRGVHSSFHGVLLLQLNGPTPWEFDEEAARLYRSSSSSSTSFSPGLVVAMTRAVRYQQQQVHFLGRNASRSSGTAARSVLGYRSSPMFAVGWREPLHHFSWNHWP